MGTSGDDRIGREDAQALAIDFKAAAKGNVERVKFHVAIEACAERLNNASLKDGPGAMKHHFHNNQESHEDDNRGNTNALGKTAASFSH